jgi:hypothetical protein
MHGDLVAIADCRHGAVEVGAIDAGALLLDAAQDVGIWLAEGVVRAHGNYGQAGVYGIEEVLCARRLAASGGL